MNHEDCLDEERMARARLEAARSRSPELEAALKQQRFLTLFREVPLTDVEKLPDPDYGL